MRSYQNNIVEPDTFFEKRIGIDRLKPEIFNDINKLTIETTGGTFVFTSLEVEKVIESFNYFTAIYRKNNKIVMIKFMDVKSVSFE